MYAGSRVSASSRTARSTGVFWEAASTNIRSSINNDNRQTLPRFQPEAMRANTRIVNALQAFGRTRGMTSAQVALGWLLQKVPWIVPIPGTTKLSHLEENLRTLDFNISSGEWKELEDAVAAIPVVGDRYNAEQQKQVGR